MYAVAAHCYAGGFTLGVRKHFEVLAQMEHDGYGHDVMALNQPTVASYKTFAEWPRERRWKGSEGAQRVRFVFANPPCAPFSSAAHGRGVGWQNDPRVQFYKDIFGLLGDIEPDVMAIESVVPSWIKGRQMHDYIAGQAEKLGYSNTVILHNALHHGVAQDRKRVFFVFHKIDMEFDEPDFNTEVTVKQAWKGLKIPAASKKRYGAHTVLPKGLADLYPQVQPGGKFYSVYTKLHEGNFEYNRLGQIKGRPSFLTKRLNLDEPTGVVMGGNLMIHPTEPRFLYPEELCALVGFPIDYKWPEKYKLGDVGAFVSRGVAPNVGEWLARSVRKSIERGKRINKPFRRVLDYRVPEMPSFDLDYVDDIPFDHSKPIVAAAPVVSAKPARQAAPSGSTVSKRGSGAYIRELLAEGKTPAQIVDLVHKEFPGSKATTADVSWNKRKLQQEQGAR